MKAETMKPMERIEAALNLEKPDRTPIIPLVAIDSVAKWKNRPLSDWVKDGSWALPATIEHFEHFGADAPFIPSAPDVFSLAFGMPMKVKLPGIDLPDDYLYQFVEEPVLQQEDYKTIADIGYAQFWHSDFIFRIRDYKPSDIAIKEAEAEKDLPNSMAAWKEKGIEPLCSTTFAHPFFILSLARSLIKFTEDLYYKPNLVEAAIKTLTPEIINFLIGKCRATGINRVEFVEEHASGYYYPLNIFERFWWPFTKEIVDGLRAEGILPIFHLDNSWNKNLHYFRELPKGSAGIQLDGTTDIFLAKEILGGHLPILGDVPATLLTIGTPEQVRDYCKRLIDRVGDNGGFILKNACVLPKNFNPDNFQAMIDTAKTYELSRQ
jgi:uroporphyrinogen-III decarboxylase